MIQDQGLRARAARFIEQSWVQRALIALIVLNAITLGLETDPEVLARYGTWLHGVDRAILAVFVIEIAIKLYAYRARFFADPWNVFDFIIVGIALVPASGPFSVLRALRVLRVLRLVSVVPSMRRVVAALLGALPGMGSIVALLALVIYVASVMATKLFGAISPEFFGTLGRSLFTLFQVMTVEGWPDIARGVMAEAPFAWIFFVVYLLISTFAVLNLFIAVVVNAMQATFEDENAAARAVEAQALAQSLARIERELSEVKAALAARR